MVARHMAGDAADHRTTEAAGFSGRRRRDEGARQRQAGEEFHGPHGSIPVAAELSLIICAGKLANCCQPPIFRE
jgi:hypothetical protein